MAKGKIFYVTTPIYYVNDVPHIGHAYCTVAADVLARYHRLAGNEVFFLTGTDEHGQKVEKAAQERGLKPQEHVDKMVIPFKDLWKRYEISYDDFIRTTEHRHEKVVQEIFKRLYEQGDIYESFYEGWYCIHEETYWPASQLAEDNKCPECGRPTQWLKEKSYYFKASAYQEKLLKHIKENPDFIQPEVRRNEVISFIKSGVQDVSVSRTTFHWGVPVSFNPEHIVYVWFDALINYLTGCGYLADDEKFKKFWPPVHLLGKDILKFHAIVWPSMLLALEVPLPKVVFATGFWTLGEEKISKSKGIVVDPHKLADEFGVDAVRYFFLREVPLGQDGEFYREALIRRLNHDLANDLGNLLHRTLPMIEKYTEGVIPSAPLKTTIATKLKKEIEVTAKSYQELMEKIDLRSALIEIWRLIGVANKFIDEAAPWSLFKQGKKEELREVLYSLAEVNRIVALLISPFMPETARKIYQQLGLETDPAQKNYARDLAWGRLPGEIKINRGKPLFPRIEEKE